MLVLSLSNRPTNNQTTKFASSQIGNYKKNKKMMCV